MNETRLTRPGNELWTKKSLAQRKKVVYIAMLPLFLCDARLTYSHTSHTFVNWIEFRCDSLSVWTSKRSMLTIVTQDLRPNPVSECPSSLGFKVSTLRIGTGWFWLYADFLISNTNHLFDRYEKSNKRRTTVTRIWWIYRWQGSWWRNEIGNLSWTDKVFS